MRKMSKKGIFGSVFYAIMAMNSEKREGIMMNKNFLSSFTKKTTNSVANTANPMLKRILEKCIQVLTKFSYSLGDIDIAMNSIEKQSALLADGAGKQATAIQTMNHTMDHLTASSTQTSENAARLSQEAEETYRKVQEKKEEIAETIRNFFEVKEELQQTVIAAKQLSDKSQEAKKLVASIEDVCLQTNILAINASIEAARAGQAGKGFAVVAQEIRSLSSKTEEVSVVITGIIEEIRTISDQATKSMQGSLNQIIKQADGLNQAVKDLEEIESSTHKFSLENSEASKQNEMLVQEITSVRELVNEMQQIVMNSVDATVDVSKSIAHQTKGLSSLTEGVNTLEKQLIDSVVLVEDRSGERKEIVMGTSPYEPFVMYDDKRDCLYGIDVDLTQEAFRRCGIELKSKLCTWDGCLYMLQKGTIDIIPAFSVDSSRSHYVDYSKPYRDKARYSFFTKKGSGVRINSYEDLYKYQVGVQDYIYNEKFNNDNRINKQMNDSDNNLYFKKLLMGQLDAIIINEYAGKYFLAKENLTDSVQIESFAFEEDSDNIMAFAKCNNLGKYSEMFHQQIENMKRDGTYKKIEDKYLRSK